MSFMMTPITTAGSCPPTPPPPPAPPRPAPLASHQPSLSVLPAGGPAAARHRVAERCRRAAAGACAAGLPPQHRRGGVAPRGAAAPAVRVLSAAAATHRTAATARGAGGYGRAGVDCKVAEAVTASLLRAGELHAHARRKAEDAQEHHPRKARESDFLRPTWECLPSNTALPSSALSDEVADGGGGGGKGGVAWVVGMLSEAALVPAAAVTGEQALLSRP